MTRNAHPKPRQRTSTRWQINYLDKITRKQKSVYGHTEQEAIERYFRRNPVDLSPTSSSWDRGTLTVSEYCERWIQTSLRCSDRRESTIYSYETTLRKRVCGDPLGKMLLIDVEPVHIEHWLLRLKDDGLSPDTCNSILRYLNQVLKTAVRDRYFQALPTSGVTRPRAATKPRAVFSQGDLQRLLNELDGKFEWAVFALIAATGLRIGEALALRWCDVNKTTSTITVGATLTKIGGRTSIGPPKTERGNRPIPVNTQVLQTILGSIREHDLRRGLVKPPRGEDLLFRTSRGTFVNDRNASRALAGAREELGLNSKLTAHSIRHYAATQMIASGIDARTVADILGHVDPGFTLKRYTHPNRAMLVTGTEALAQSLNFTGLETEGLECKEPGTG